MSELSEEEKRRILRERRAAKLSKGGASTRLNKITSGVSNSFLPTDSPIDKKASAPASASASSSPSPAATATATSSTTENDSLNTEPIINTSRLKSFNKSSPPVNSKRISQSFTTEHEDKINEDEDPQIVDLDSFIKDSKNKLSSPHHHTSVPDPLNENLNENGNEVDIDQLLNSILHGNQHSAAHNNSNDPNQQQPPLPDDFMKTMASMLGGQNPFENGAFGDSTDGKNPFAAFIGGGDGGIPNNSGSGPTLEEMDYQTKLTEYYNLRNRKIRSVFTLIRYISILILMFRTIINLEIQPTFQNPELIKDKFFQPSTNFWNYFLIIEVIFQSTFLLFISQDKNYSSGSFLVNLLNTFGSFLPINYRKLVLIFVKYQESLLFFIKDISFVVFILGLIAIFS